MVRVCRSSGRHPWRWLAATFVLCLPAAIAVRDIGLNTDLLRLLPEQSPASRWTRQIGKVVAEGGNFTIVFQGDDTNKLVQAVESTADRVRAVEGVYAVEYRVPLEFFRHYRYLLMPKDYLAKISEYLVRLEAAVNPMTLDLLDEPNGSGKRPDPPRDVQALLDRYGALSAYHQSRDGHIMGLFIRPGQGFTDLRTTRSLLTELETIAAAAADEFGLWADVGGSQIENLKEYDLIVRDLRRSGLIGSVAIILALLIGFHSLRVLPVLIYPLAVGLLWAFSLVPAIVGDLNLITSFLLLVLFGTGIDYSIHLVGRFQLELRDLPADEALERTFVSTGTSVLVSGLTTALPLFILTLSDFRGFSDFGLIGGSSILVILLAMVTVMPAVLVLGQRAGLVRPTKRARQRAMPQPGRHALLPGRGVTVLLSLAALAALPLAGLRFRFDYDFNSVKAPLPQATAYKDRHRQVYARSQTPGAVYVAPDMATLDQMLAVFDTRMAQGNTTIRRVTSMRDFVPSETQMRERLRWLEEIRDVVSGRWVDRIDDPRITYWVQDIRQWIPPALPPRLEDIPASLRRSLETKDGSGRPLACVIPGVARNHGKKVMAFAAELHELEFPAGVQGPVGEMPVFAEILQLVTADAVWMVGLTFLGVVLLVLLECGSVRDTVWTIMPLVLGMVLTTGLMGALGFKLNFFNVVVMPALLGMGVDDGVHYYRRWKELGGNAVAAHRELLGPLTLTTVTTMMGYSGMMFAAHPGLQAIGRLACLGMSCMWVSSLLLLPGILAWRGQASGSSTNRS